MGQAMSFGLTQYDVEELMTFTGNVFSQEEIEGLYKRFRSLDRARKGYISAEEFLSIPELSINPLARRLERLFESVNFKDFVGFLAAFSARASRDDKLRFMFRVADMDGDDALGPDDLTLLLRHLAGSALSEDEMKQIVAKALAEAGVGQGGALSYADFARALEGADLAEMVVEVPRDG